MSEENKGWAELGIITKNSVRKRDDEGNFVKDSQGNYVNVTDDKGQVVYKLGFKLADDITILRNGAPVAINEARTGILKTPVQEVEQLYKHGQIGDDKIETRRDSAKKAHSWLRYKIQLPPPRD